MPSSSKSLRKPDDLPETPAPPAGAAAVRDIALSQHQQRGARPNNSIEVLAALVGHSSDELPSSFAEAPWPPRWNRWSLHDRPSLPSHDR
jgi:hypothetical protein